MESTFAVQRMNNKIVRDTTRVIARLHAVEPASRIKKIIDRVVRLTEHDADNLKKNIKQKFSSRHKNLERMCLLHYDKVTEFIPDTLDVSDIQKFLIGAYFTMEYSIESAALFNPSIVPHPDQSNIPAGSVRFIMSLRATGERHISSIVFRTGIVDGNADIVFDDISRFAETPLIRKVTSKEDSEYMVEFQTNQELSERVIFPVLKNESNGIEDARFVRFIDDSGNEKYYATYTAYDGFTTRPQLIETTDFLTFKVVTLSGKAVVNKGMALFPRKINGKYVSLSRQDGENNHIMFSDNVHQWEESKIFQEPTSEWEFIQIGNCGSPIETDRGWLVLTHGVGPMRQYSIGAILLDRNKPEKVIAHLEEPLITPTEDEREGYVPNVVYSCGSMLHRDTLIIPYAMSDISTGVATVNIHTLLNEMISI